MSFKVLLGQTKVMQIRLRAIAYEICCYYDQTAITKTVKTTRSRSKILSEHSRKTVNTLALETGPKGPRLVETVASVVLTKKGPGTIHSSIMMCSI